jgi:hypothetical protein
MLKRRFATMLPPLAQKLRRYARRGQPPEKTATPKREY